MFSVGSIAWYGALPHHGWDNDIARITDTVVRRFADPEPFTPPSGCRPRRNVSPMTTMATTSDLAAIEATLQVYFDGLYEADPAKLAVAFHPVAHLYSVSATGWRSICRLPIGWRWSRPASPAR